MSVCFFSSTLNGEYSNRLIVVAFSNKSYPVKNSYLLTFRDNKVTILIVCLSNLNFLSLVEINELCCARS